MATTTSVLSQAVSRQVTLLLLYPALVALLELLSTGILFHLPWATATSPMG